MQFPLPNRPRVQREPAHAINRLRGKWRDLLARETQRARAEAATRFLRPSDWIRVVALGVILADLAIFAIVNIFSEQMLEGYFPGCSAVFEGLAASIFIFRIGRPRLFPEWLFAAMAYIAVGLVFANNPTLHSGAVFVCFIALFVIAAVARIWIGWTVPIGSPWLIAGGVTGIFCAAALLTSRMMAEPLDPDFVLAVDLIIQSAAVFGFGFSLRRSAT